MTHRLCPWWHDVQSSRSPCLYAHPFQQCGRVLDYVERSMNEYHLGGEPMVDVVH